jgi:hypothetical protein
MLRRRRVDGQVPGSASGRAAPPERPCAPPPSAGARSSRDRRRPSAARCRGRHGDTGSSGAYAVQAEQTSPAKLASCPDGSPHPRPSSLLWPSPATRAAELWPPTLSAARKQRQLFVRTAPAFAPLNTCSGAKSRRFRPAVSEWTRTQGIRTAAEITVVASIIDAASAPVYLEISEKAAHLRELGMSDRAIARSIGVDDKTVAKSLRLRGREQRREVGPPAVSEPRQPD